MTAQALPRLRPMTATAADAVRGRCATCHKLRQLRADTGGCAWCSRTCSGCGAPRRSTELLCAAGKRRAVGHPARGQCQHCGRRRVVDAVSQRCRSCTDPANAPAPARCDGRGNSGQWANGLCKRWYEYSPHTVLTRAAGWARRMPEPPSWWTDFAAHPATQRHPFYAADTIAETARLILSNTANSPTSLIAHARDDSPQLVGRSPTSSVLTAISPLTLAAIRRLLDALHPDSARHRHPERTLIHTERQLDAGCRLIRSRHAGNGRWVAHVVGVFSISVHCARVSVLVHAHA